MTAEDDPRLDAATGVDPGVDPAVDRARRVLGLYGDPDVSWSIVLALGFSAALTAADVDRAVVALAGRAPHLGRAADLDRFAADGEDEVLARFADTPYGDRDPLLRVALSEDGRTLVVAAHHGAVDGLGLLGAASALSGVPLTSSAQGIERTAEPTGFLRSGLSRLAEAALRPPARLAATPRPGETGDWLASRHVQANRPSSGALLAAAVAAVRRWNTDSRAPGRIVVAMGLSRRPGTPTPQPDRDTAFVRLVADDADTTSDASALIAATPPEPAFPVTDGGGLAPRVARLLSSRLGSTLLVSNLGRLQGAGLEEARFWPVPAGPAGAAVGLASTVGGTTVTVRLRRGWFTREATATFASLVDGELERAARP